MKKLFLFLITLLVVPIVRGSMLTIRQGIGYSGVKKTTYKKTTIFHQAGEVTEEQIEGKADADGVLIVLAQDSIGWSSKTDIHKIWLVNNEKVYCDLINSQPNGYIRSDNGNIIFYFFDNRKSKHTFTFVDAKTGPSPEHCSNAVK